MKTLLTKFTLVFTLMFSSASFAEWTKVTEDAEGNTFYVDFERIRKVDGYIYYWMLRDLLKPDANWSQSYSKYYQGDCKIFRVKLLSWASHLDPMGRGFGSPNSPDNPIWNYPRPESVEENLLEEACSR